MVYLLLWSNLFDFDADAKVAIQFTIFKYYAILTSTWDIGVEAFPSPLYLINNISFL
jgi:hypothetical protein